MPIRISALIGTNRDYASFLDTVTTTTATTAASNSFPSNQPELPEREKDFGNGMSGKESRNFRDVNDEFNLSGVSVERDEDRSGFAETTKRMEEPEPLEVVEPDLNDDVDVLDDKSVWKPRLIFENKTKTTTTTPSVIMRIGPKNIDVELFNIEAAPFQKGRLSLPLIRGCAFFIS